MLGSVGSSDRGTAVWRNSDDGANGDRDGMWLDRQASFLVGEKVSGAWIPGASWCKGRVRRYFTNIESRLLSEIDCNDSQKR